MIVLEMVKTFFSAQAGGRAHSYIILNKIENGDSSLFLYEDGINVKDIFLPFLEKELRNGSVCFYAAETSETNGKKLDAKKDYFAFSFTKNVLFPNIVKFKQKFKEVAGIAEKRNHSLRVMVDWGNIRNWCNEESQIIEGVQALEEKASEKIPRPWKKSFREVRQRNFPIIFINAFNLTSISSELLNQLLQLHKRVVLLTKNENMASLPGFSLAGSFAEPANEALPEEILEQVVKKNLELVTLSMLEKGPLSGYSLLKEISSQFHILLSQGTVYPLLYSLEKSGILAIKNGVGREKIYELTAKGKDHASKSIAHFRKAYSFLLSLK